jgi:hypothetical protein
MDSWGILILMFGILKVYEEGWKITSQQELISRIQLQLKNFDIHFLKALQSVTTITNFYLTDKDFVK